MFQKHLNKMIVFCKKRPFFTFLLFSLLLLVILDSNVLNIIEGKRNRRFKKPVNEANKILKDLQNDVQENTQKINSNSLQINKIKFN